MLITLAASQDHQKLAEIDEARVCVQLLFPRRMPSQNLTLRMSQRRFTRLTNAFSKKLENHALSIALHYMHYNFCRIHKTLRVTPAMAAGVTDRLWTVADLVALVEAAEPEPGKRGPYKKQAAA
jgi:hypothetical protein